MLDISAAKNRFALYPFFTPNGYNFCFPKGNETDVEDQSNKGRDSAVNNNSKSNIMHD